MLTLGREDPNTTISMISGLGSFVIFEGIQTSIDKNSYFCDFQGGGGVWYPLSLPLDPRMKIQIVWQFIVHPCTATIFILKMLLLIVYATYIRVNIRLEFFMGINIKNPDKMILRRGLWLVGFVALRPKSTAMVIAGRSVHLTTHFFWAGLNQVNQ